MDPDSSPGLSLRDAVIGAAEAPPSDRIRYRDPIAQHGAAGIQAIEGWLGDPKLAAFAVRTIARAASFGAEAEALRALRRALQAPVSPTIAQDIVTALSHLGAAPAAARKGTGRVSGERSDPERVLIVGDTYKRRDLHGRFGGNQQSGISYPSQGSYALLFSDPNAAREHGYKDRWEGGEYRYYGAWSGEGDMELTTHNRRIVDRSPNLHLFRKMGELWRYEGRFECLRAEPEGTVRDGRELSAIVFVLRAAP